MALFRQMAFAAIATVIASSLLAGSAYGRFADRCRAKEVCLCVASGMQSANLFTSTDACVEVLYSKAARLYVTISTILVCYVCSEHRSPGELQAPHRYKILKCCKFPTTYSCVCSSSWDGELTSDKRLQQFPDHGRFDTRPAKT